MNLAGLLSELRNNILRDRSDQVSGPSDRLWSDESLVRYINEAHNRFARESLCIRDKVTAEVCTVHLQPMVAEYALHKSVLGILSAKYTTDNGDLARAGHAALGTYQTPDTYFFDPSSLAVLPPGKVKAYSTDEGFQPDDDGAQSIVTLRVYPVPLAEYATQINLRVVRLPVREFTLVDTAASPEIPGIYHLDMLDWAAYLALRVADHDAEDLPRADKFAASFEAKVQAAKRDVMRKAFTPAQWGFGRSGFSWAGN